MEYLEKNAHTMMCSVCKNMVDITFGTVFFDARWYHQGCWTLMEDGGNFGKSNSN